MRFYLKILFVHILFFSQFIVSISTITPDTHKDLIAVVIMVKDEVDVIIPTLQPLINGGIDSILVYDTGSTDGTQQVAHTYFEQHGLIHAHIIEEPFIDFATSRNRSLDLAEELFPNIPFFLMLDAEWYTYNVGELIEFCKTNEHYIAPGTQGGCYAIRLVTLQDNIDNYTPRLIRRGKNARYAGVVHESIQQRSSGQLPKTVYFEYAPKETGREKSKQRCARDLQLLKKSLANDPTNLRTMFYLGQTCQFLDDWDQAIYYYKKRAGLGEISEERYLALYRIACAIEHIIYTCTQNNDYCKYQWEDALHYYLQAHAMLPHRAEPLIRIAAYYLRNNQHPVAYLFAHRAVLLPYPQNDTLFVEKYAYDYLRYDILGQCALYTGEFEEGKNAVLKALAITPEASHLHHNLSVYLQYLPA